MATPAAEMAATLLLRLESGSVSDVDFQTELGALRACVRRLSVSVARTTPRLYTGRPANAA